MNEPKSSRTITTFFKKGAARAPVVVLMEEAARRRKERLAALRAGAPLAEIEEPQEDIITKLAYEEKPEEKANEVSTSIFAGDQTLEEQVKFLLNEAKSLPSLEMGGEEVKLEDLAPKKANWDLRQDYERRTAPLQKQYERACAELIHERLAKEAEQPEEG